MSKLNFVIIGTGLISTIHADALNMIDRVCLKGVFDKNIQRADEFALKYNIKRYESYKEVLSDPEVDAVCICTPSGLHADQAIEALNSGKNVVVEKPMALTEEDCDRVVGAVRKTGKTFTVICQLRFSDDVREIKKLYEDGAFGNISLCDLYMKYWREPEYYSSSVWRGTKALDGGGALMNQGIHGIDMLIYIAGNAKPVESKVKAAFHNIEVEDTAIALVTFDNGALGVIEGSTCAFPGFERRLEINGSSGCAVVTSGEIEKLVLNGEDVTPEKKNVKKLNSAADPAAMDCMLHKKQLENFIGAVYGEEELVIDALEGKRAVKLICDIYKLSDK